MTENEIKKFVNKYDFISVPLVQKELGLSYIEARKAVEEMEKRGELIKDTGVSFRVRAFAKPRPPAPVPPDPSTARRMSLAERFARIAKDQRDRGNQREAPQLDELAKKALWSSIKNGFASPVLFRRELGVSMGLSFRLVDRLRDAGLISSTSPYIPEITEKEFLERYGSVEEGDGELEELEIDRILFGDDNDNDEDDSVDVLKLLDEDDDEDDEEEEADGENEEQDDEGAQQETADYAAIRSDLVSRVGKLIGFTSEHGRRCLSVHLRGQEYFEVFVKNSDIYLTDFGDTNVSSVDPTAFMAVLIEYPFVRYEDGRLTCKIIQDDVLTAAATLHAVIERVKHLR